MFRLFKEMSNKAVINSLISKKNELSFFIEKEKVKVLSYKEIINRDFKNLKITGDLPVDALLRDIFFSYINSLIALKNIAIKKYEENIARINFSIEHYKSHSKKNMKSQELYEENLVLNKKFVNEFREISSLERNLEDSISEISNFIKYKARFSSLKQNKQELINLSFALLNNNQYIIKSKSYAKFLSELDETSYFKSFFSIDEKIKLLDKIISRPAVKKSPDQYNDALNFSEELKRRNSLTK